MLMFVVLFFSSLPLTSLIVTAVFGVTHAFYQICTLVIFASIVLAIFTHSNRAWVVFFLAILVMVSVQVLAPLSLAVQYIFSFGFAVLGTGVLKSVLNPIIRRSRLERSMKTLLMWL